MADPLPGSSNWRAINTALEEGLRGLPGDDSLRRLRRRQESDPVDSAKGC